MAEADPTQEKLKKYEKAVKKLKAAHEKATTELTEQKMTFESALAEKAALVESLKAAAKGSKEEGGGGGEDLQEKIEEQEEKIKEAEENVIKGEEKLKLQVQATKDKLEAQKVKMDEEWNKKFEEAGLNTDKPKEKQWCRSSTCLHSRWSRALDGYLCGHGYITDGFFRAFLFG